MMTIVVYFMIALLVIRLLAEIKQLVCEECKCRSRASVNPGETTTVNDDIKTDDQKKKKKEKKKKNLMKK